MMPLVQLIIAVLLFAGLYMVARCHIILPSYATVKAFSGLNGHKTTVKDQLIFPVARKVEKIIHLDETRKETLAANLKAADISGSPEFYLATAITCGLLLLIPALLLLPVIPFLGGGFAILAILIFFKEYNRVQSITDKRNQMVNTEIPPLAVAIGEALRNGYDYLPVLESQSRLCSPTFKKELDLLIADMKTGSRTEALTRFESRMNSERVSELVKGLKSIEKGDDINAYMQRTLLHMDEYEHQELTREAKKRPSELFSANAILFVALLIFYIVIMGGQLVGSLHGLFG